jgi:D-beta-D-heptose 7-phosphate kinase/D-beta-D-heptose 1-phosphate adenosyltransferase
VINSNTKVLWEGATVRIKVVGDVILDEYQEGSVDRISPEAPVPVHKIIRTVHAAGGAANVAKSIRLSGGDVCLFGVCGKDEAAERLRELISECGIDYSGVVVDETRPTIRKTRITANHQQLLRIDWEDVKELPVGIEESILGAISGDKFECLVISDYGKGCLSTGFIKKLIDYCLENSIPSVVDPKGSNFEKYRGAYLITPNYSEACQSIGVDKEDHPSGEFLAQEIQSKYGIKNVLVTLGAQGMVLVKKSGEIHKVSSNAREVFDVSGAGDAVVAVMALSLGVSADICDAMELANIAGGIVVEKWGTKPITLQELKDRLYSPEYGGSRSITQKFKNRVEISLLCEKLKDSGKKVVFTNGCFDILHHGHVDYLEKSKSEGDVLVVGVNGDDSVQRLKGVHRPINTCRDRMSLLAALESVDYVTEFGEDTPEELIKSILPNVLVKGGDYEVGQVVGREVVEAAGGDVKIISFLDGYSTSSIIKKIAQEG